jgi:hypothetical protein
VARSLRGPFSVGAGFTIDEFALRAYLDDVYWAEEGRSSIDAAVISAGLMLLVLLGRSAVRIFPPLLLVTACFVKQRVLHGALACSSGRSRSTAPRLSPSRDRRERSASTPDCNPGKQTNAERRFHRDKRTERFKEHLRDKINGTTNDVFQAKQAPRHQAVAGPRRWAERERPLPRRQRKSSHDLSSIW